MGEDIAVNAATQAGEISLLSGVTNASPLGLAVLLILVGFSIVSWGIILLKFLNIQKAQKSSVLFLETFWESKRLDDIFQQTESLHQSPIAQVFRAGYQELVKVKQKEQQAEGHLGGEQNVERSLRRATSSELSELSRMIPFLATVGSTSPFIGLFGTVVGIMNTFAEIGAKGGANLAVVAPGISEALVATAAGLAAAIPAVMAYNYFNTRLGSISNEMENFSSDFMNIVRRHFF